MRAIASSGTTFAVLLFSVASGYAAPAQTPEQLIENLVAAARQGDLAAYVSQLDARSRRAVSEAKEERTKLRLDFEKYQRALDEQFGGGGPTIGPVAQDGLKTGLGRLINAQIIGQNGRKDVSEMRVRSTFRSDDGRPVSREDKLVAHRERDGWKLALDVPRSGRSAELHAAIEEVTRNIRAGEYRDRQTAMVALANALTRLGRVVR
jgi:hypothetical protein